MPHVFLEDEHTLKLAKSGGVGDGDRLITYREISAVAQLTDYGFDLIEVQCSPGG